MGTLFAPGQSAATLPPGATGSNVATPETLEQIASTSSKDENGNPRVAGGFVMDPASGIETFTPSKQQPPSEPTVLSSGNISDNVIPNNTATLAGLADKGSYQGEDGQTYNADGTLVSTPDTNPEDDPETANIQGLIASLKGNLDASTKESIDAIEQNYTELKAEQTRINGQASSSRQAALLTGGTSRYSPDTASGIMGTQLSYGLSQIAKLDADENTAISQAKQAQQTGDMAIADKYIQDAQTIRQQKQTTAKQLNASLSKARDDALTQSRLNAIDSGVATLVQNGTTDPADILTALTNQGLNASADEVTKTLNDLLSTTGAGSLKNLTGDVKNFTALQQSGQLPASILSLPSEQQLAAYIAMVHSAAKGSLSSALAAAGGIDTSGTTPVVNDSTGTPISVPMTADGNPDPTAQMTFLASLPGGPAGDVSTLVQGLADYTINPASFTTRNYKGASGMTQSQVLALVKQFDPTYDQKQYASASAMQKNVTSGPYSQTITAANTLVSHLADLKKDMDDMYDPKKGGLTIPVVGGKAGETEFAGFPGVNIKLGLQNLAGGNPYVKKFLTDAQAVSTEAAKVYKGSSSPSEGEISTWSKTFSPTQNPATNQAALEAVLNLMGGKLGTIAQNYKQALGKTQGLQILTPSSVSILKSLGLDPADYDPTYDESSDLSGHANPLGITGGNTTTTSSADNPLGI